MVEANEAGRSLRTIAAAAGYSHEKVRVILARERTRGATVEEPTHVAHEDPVSAQPPVGEFSRIQASLAKLREALTPPLSGLE